MLTFHLLTIFPDIFDSYLKEGILARALQGNPKEEKVAVKVYNLRDFTTDKHRTVDDTPYGGGAGMVLKVEPIYHALETIKKNIKEEWKSQKKKAEKGKIRTILLAAKGQPYNQTKAAFYQQNFTDLILICGRYEGVDERVAQHLVDEELSIGPFVLSGGELPALTVVDSVARLVPGVLGNQESLANESFNPEPTSAEKVVLQASSNPNKPQLDYPAYTKPEEFRGWKVPEILLSGHHAHIEKWRKEQQGKV